MSAPIQNPLQNLYITFEVKISCYSSQKSSASQKLGVIASRLTIHKYMKLARIQIPKRRQQMISNTLVAVILSLQEELLELFLLSEQKLNWPQAMPRIAMVVNNTKTNPKTFIIMLNYLYQSFQTLSHYTNGSPQKPKVFHFLQENQYQICICPCKVVYQNKIKMRISAKIPSILIFVAILLEVQSQLIRGGRLERQQRILRMLQSVDIGQQNSVDIYQWLNWLQNDQIIQNQNSQVGRTFKLAHNQFSIMSVSQVYQGYLGLAVTQADKNRIISVSVPKKNSPQYIQTPLQKGKSTSVPQLLNTLSIDWRSSIITSVKNQGKCGACWAFAAVANLESLYASLTSNFNDFSEQQLIDCSFSEGNNGCAGGMMINAFNYVIKNPITIEKDYQYTGESQSCQRNSLGRASFTIKSSESIVNDCSGLKNILKAHPVTVVISADANFIFYQSGVLNVCGTVVNHAVQIVGIVENRTPNATKGYYIGKNSWGTTWGESGFFRLDSQANGGNLCDVCLFVQYPTY